MATLSQVNTPRYRSPPSSPRLASLPETGMASSIPPAPDLRVIDTHATRCANTQCAAYFGKGAARRRFHCRREVWLYSFDDCFRLGDSSSSLANTGRATRVMVDSQTCGTCRSRHHPGISLTRHSNGGQGIVLDADSLIDGRQEYIRISETQVASVDMARLAHTAMSLNRHSAADTARMFMHGIFATARDTVRPAKSNFSRAVERAMIAIRATASSLLRF